jgi:hypothetical protein
LQVAVATGILSTIVVSGRAIGIRSCFVESGKKTRIGQSAALDAYARGVAFRR